MRRHHGDDLTGLTWHLQSITHRTWGRHDDDLAIVPFHSRISAISQACRKIVIGSSCNSNCDTRPGQAGINAWWKLVHSLPLMPSPMRQRVQRMIVVHDRRCFVQGFPQADLFRAERVMTDSPRQALLVDRKGCVIMAWC